MSAVWMRIRADARRGWRAWLSLALILGIAGGGAVAAAAGARRSSTAYPRFVEAQDGYHALTGGGFNDDVDGVFSAIRARPDVASTLEILVVGGEVSVPARRGREAVTVSIPEVVAVADPTGALFYERNRAKVLEGRLPDRGRADEVSLPFVLAERLGVRLGDTVTVGYGFNLETFAPLGRADLRVVGIQAAPGEFEGVGQTTIGLIGVTPAFLRAHPEAVPPRVLDLTMLAVYLKDGSGGARTFKNEVEIGLRVDVPLIEPVTRKAVQSSMNLYAAALWLIAALLAIAGTAVFGQTLARQVALDSSEYPTLRALGSTRSALIAVGMGRALIVGVAGALLAAGVAFLASPLMPIGVARIAEPSPGFAFDGLAIGGGAAIVLVVAVLLGVWPSYRAARLASSAATANAESRRASAVVRALSSMTTSAATVIGVRMALEPGRGRSAVPVRSTILAIAFGVAAVTGTVVVGQSLSHLLATPSLTGFTYDAIVPDEGDEGEEARRRRLTEFPFVDDVAVGTAVNASIKGVDSFILSLDARSDIRFALIAGREPTDAAGDLPEIALGPSTMRRIGAVIGDPVEFMYEDHGDDEEAIRKTQAARVVGIAAVPALPWAATDPGEGGLMSLGAIRTFLRHEQGGCCFVRFKDGTDLVGARRTLEDAGFPTYLRTKRTDLATLERITALPVALAGLFGVLAVAALAHVLVSAIRRRRRDLAILKTLGFVSAQVRATLAWQATVLAIACVVVGVPAGIALGRWGWRAVASEFGVVPVPVAPVVPLALVLPIAVVVANIIAFAPGKVAARTEPGLALRVE